MKWRKFQCRTIQHAKTGGANGCSPLMRDVLFFQVIAENIVGVLRKSPQQIARDCGGGTTAADVVEALEALQQRELVQWWPDLELVWAIDCAEHQCANGSAWKHARQIVADLPECVRVAFGERYPVTSVKPKNKREQQQVARRRSVDEHVARFRELVTHEIGAPKPPNAQRLGALICPDRHLRDLIDQGETADTLAETARRVSRRIESGALPPRFWSALSFSAYYPALRDGLPIEGHSRPVVVDPTCETEEDARAYASTHGGVLPAGWRYEADGHGAHAVVRA